MVEINVDKPLASGPVWRNAPNAGEMPRLIRRRCAALRVRQQTQSEGMQ